jgi:hypothetical protein
MKSIVRHHPRARLLTNLHITSERETPLITYQVAREIHLERQREIERRLQLRIGNPAPTPRSSIRRRVGRGLIRFGSMLAADGPLQLAARR